MKIAVLAGGPSFEHDVSLASSRQIIVTLSEKHSVVAVLISKQNKWGFGDSLDSIKPNLDLLDGLKKLMTLNIDIVFLGLHGNFGEDGRLQAFLEILNIPFTGSGSLSSALAMNKVVSQELMSAQDIPTIKSVDFWRKDWETNQNKTLDLCSALGDVVMIKPADAGSSVGVYKNLDHSSLSGNIGRTLEYSEHIMAQPCVVGREFSCSVLEQDGQPNALPVTEIIPKTSDFFDYQAKYTRGASKEITPAKLDPGVFQKIQELATRAHLVHGCRGYSRTDFILSNDGLYVLELNTLPGMTDTSLLPQQAKAADIGFANLLDIIIETGLR